MAMTREDLIISIRGAIDAHRNGEDFIEALWKEISYAAVLTADVQVAELSRDLAGAWLRVIDQKEAA